MYGWWLQLLQSFSPYQRSRLCGWTNGLEKLLPCVWQRDTPRHCLGKLIIPYIENLTMTGGSEALGPRRSLNQARYVRSKVVNITLDKSGAYDVRCGRSMWWRGLANACKPKDISLTSIIVASLLSSLGDNRHASTTPRRTLWILCYYDGDMDKSGRTQRHLKTAGDW